MFMNNTLLHALIVAMLAATPLAAQDNNAFRFGAGFTAVLPTGDWSKFVSAGFGPSIFVEKPFSNNLVIRGEADYIKFGKKTVDMAEWGMSVEGDWYFNKHNIGPFVLATLNFRDITYMRDTGLSRSSESASYLGYAAGFGYGFNKRFSIAFEYVFGHLYDDNYRLPSDFLLTKQGKSDAVAKGGPINFIPQELNWAVSRNKSQINRAR